MVAKESHFITIHVSVTTINVELLGNKLEEGLIIPNSTFRLGPTPMFTCTGELHPCRPRTPTVYMIF